MLAPPQSVSFFAMLGTLDPLKTSGVHSFLSVMNGVLVLAVLAMIAVVAVTLALLRLVSSEVCKPGADEAAPAVVRVASQRSRLRKDSGHAETRRYPDKTA